MSHQHAAHGHDHAKTEIDWLAEADRLVRAAADDAAWYAEAALLLLRPDDKLAVDFACGGAGMATALAASSDALTVVGLDRDAAMYAAVADRLPGVAFATGSFEDDPEALREAVGGAPDLIWSRNAVHHADNGQDAVATLTAMLAPGGRLALAEGGLKPRFLPYDLGIGEPGLEDALHAAIHAEYRKVSHHVRMEYGWPVALRRAGLVDVTTVPILTDLPAPLAPTDRERVVRKLTLVLSHHRDHLDPVDRAAWDRLLDPADEAWIGGREDLHHLEVRTIHIGHKPA
ncbi:class I SAM-dependent methyltransferase [Phytomonospora endophytica]|uniref:SAM-dependent methyltransferase n=1 Tax=Phytomonospora endophytica TaxID=714109 RepID=A0A841FIC2_9ACTN|nr:class I SAM-dependent methyltransferase [Phytomonospora endophytica]MBB6033588.1 SAM-dependent methyltransferase [Phytomonospora endophytica]GIG64896.1 SAM-dependent methyltransferase [Phytomonospora endophytica]